MIRRGKINALIVLLLLMSLVFSSGQGVRASTSEKDYDFYPSRGRFLPGEEVKLVFEVLTKEAEEKKLTLELTISHLNLDLYREVKGIKIKPGQKEVVFTWDPLADDFTGYGADLKVKNQEGKVITTLSTAFDVASDWTVFPRYGFVCDFGKGEKDIKAEMEEMNKFHINGLQFYDWMYRHDDLLPPGDEFVDPLGRKLSMDVIRKKIEVAREYNMASMAYTALYAASKDFFQQHPEWGLYNLAGEPITFGDDWLNIMNIAKGSPWNKHFINECQEVMEETNFDGIHLDQYGYPEVGFSQLKEKREKVDVGKAFTGLINEVSRGVKKIDSEAKVIFNAVNNWPIEEVAISEEDVVYIEVWPPHDMYMDLVDLINEGRNLSGGKPVVLAAYIDPENEKAVRLADAIIFSQGGYHIELGEGKGMLSDPYFPKYKEMSPALEKAIRNYYDFLVRYENILSSSELVSIDRRVEIEGLIADTIPSFDVIFTTAKARDNYEIINLVNMVNGGINWKMPKLKAPPVYEDKKVKYYTEGNIKGVFWASADGSPQLNKLKFGEGKDENGSYIEFILPRLYYWDLVLVEKE